ncbi:VQ motif-containing protein 10-like [Actinidia eriantha]|uniref:VQ motif-containing protein 10-like n=1 Tax=Actinidia eriantha TaxID=165200 RepID=UPI0025902E51|nr:VQ motif-containing protein 10-like [Actinidia eriantha]
MSREPTKIVFINTEYVETDAASFKSVIQRLTGKDATVGIKSGDGVVGLMAEMRGGGDGGGVLKRGVSFKDFDRLLRELPNLEELYRLCGDGI